MAVRNEYTETVRDLKALIRREADERKRADLVDNVDKMQTLIERQREKLENLSVLTERVDGLVWLVRGVVVTTAIEIIVGITVALMVKGHG